LLFFFLWFLYDLIQTREMKTQKLRRTQLTSLSNSRWAAYATAGAATAIAGAQMETAEAAIHYSGPINAVVAGTPSQYDLQYFALTPGKQFGLIHVETSSGSAGIARFIIGGHGSFVSAGFRGFVAGGFPYVSKLASGNNFAGGAFVMSAAHYFGTMAFRGGYGNDQWLAAGTGFIGFEFNIGGGLQYGWARVKMDGSPQNTMTLIDYAWGDVGTAINAGQIPEPGSLGLLALGGAGLLAWRKRRSKVVAA
jgi:hypothetical protein